MKPKHPRENDELSIRVDEKIKATHTRLEKETSGSGTHLHFGDRSYEIDTNKNVNCECVSPGTNSEILYIKDIQTSQHLVLKLARGKYINHETYGQHGVSRLAQEVFYQTMASKQGLAPQILDYGWTSHPDNNRQVQYILMENKGESLDCFDSTDNINIAELKQGVQMLYQNLARIGLKMQEISLENIVRDSDGKVFAIDFDPEGVRLILGRVADNHTTELLELLEVTLAQEDDYEDSEEEFTNTGDVSDNISDTTESTIEQNDEVGDNFQHGVNWRDMFLGDSNIFSDGHSLFDEAAHHPPSTYETSERSPSSSGSDKSRSPLTTLPFKVFMSVSNI